MQLNEKNRLVLRIINGYTPCKVGSLYYVGIPPVVVLQQASLLYDDIMSRYRFEGWLTQDEAKEKLIGAGVIPSDVDKQLTDIEKALESFKKQLFTNFTIVNDRYRQGKKIIADFETKRAELIGKMHYLDAACLETLAASECGYFIAQYTQCDSNFQRLWEGPIQHLLLRKIQAEYQKQWIGVKEYRELARTDPWRSYWNSQKNGAFRVIGEEQQNLIMYSRMYDNAYKHMECPSDFVINDDDLFDGWLLHQREKAAGDKAESPVLKSNPDAQELYIMVKNQEEANQVLDLNSADTKNIIKEREMVIKKVGEIHDMALPDNKREIERLIREKGKNG